VRFTRRHEHCSLQNQSQPRSDIFPFVIRPVESSRLRSFHDDYLYFVMTTSKDARLNIGCGTKHIPGAVNLDVSQRVGADVVHDLNRLPWPFIDDAFDEVFAYDVIEHLESVVAALSEISRVSRRGATLHLTVPHFSSANAFTDVTHRHWFGWRSLDPFLASQETSHSLGHYSRTKFRRIAAQIYFHPSLVNKFVWRCANQWPDAYERRWAWVFPAWFMSVDLEVMKDSP
jgi:predicted SAM-dependent methyltransferase